MRIRKSTLKRIIREATLKESPFEVPQRLRALEAQMKKIAVSEGFPEVAKSVRSFNSGYIGVTYTGPDGTEMMLLDQPGAVGLEDQTGGYVWFGDPKTAAGIYDASTSIQGAKSFAGNNGSGRYGDVDITEADRREVYNEFIGDFVGILQDLK